MKRLITPPRLSAPSTTLPSQSPPSINTRHPGDADVLPPAGISSTASSRRGSGDSNTTSSSSLALRRAQKKASISSIGQGGEGQGGPSEDDAVSLSTHLSLSSIKSDYDDIYDASPMSTIQPLQTTESVLYDELGDLVDDDDDDVAFVEGDVTEPKYVTHRSRYSQLSVVSSHNDKLDGSHRTLGVRPQPPVLSLPHLRRRTSSESMRSVESSGSGNSLRNRRETAKFLIALELSTEVKMNLPIAVSACPGLYIGSLVAADTKATLKDLGITHIVSLGQNTPPAYPNEFTYLVCELRDKPQAPILGLFQLTNMYISSVLGGKSTENKKGNVLVHCVQGKSRSASVVLAYLIGVLGMPLRAAIQALKDDRPSIAPNPGFLASLAVYEELKEPTRYLTERHRRCRSRNDECDEVIGEASYRLAPHLDHADGQQALMQVLAAEQCGMDRGRSMESDHSVYTFCDRTSDDDDDDGGKDIPWSCGVTSMNPTEDIFPSLVRGICLDPHQRPVCSLYRPLMAPVVIANVGQHGKMPSTLPRTRNADDSITTTMSYAYHCYRCNKRLVSSLTDIIHDDTSCCLTVIVVFPSWWMGEIHLPRGYIICPNPKCAEVIGKWSWLRKDEWQRTTSLTDNGMTTFRALDPFTPFLCHSHHQLLGDDKLSQWHLQNSAVPTTPPSSAPSPVPGAITPCALTVGFAPAFYLFRQRLLRRDTTSDEGDLTTDMENALSSLLKVDDSNDTISCGDDALSCVQDSVLRVKGNDDDGTSDDPEDDQDVLVSSLVFNDEDPSHRCPSAAASALTHQLESAPKFKHLEIDLARSFNLSMPNLQRQKPSTKMIEDDDNDVSIPSIATANDRIYPYGRRVSYLQTVTSRSPEIPPSLVSSLSDAYKTLTTPVFKSLVSPATTMDESCCVPLTFSPDTDVDSITALKHSASIPRAFVFPNADDVSCHGNIDGKVITERQPSSNDKAALPPILLHAVTSVSGKFNGSTVVASSLLRVAQSDDEMFAPSWITKDELLAFR